MKQHFTILVIALSFLLPVSLQAQGEFGLHLQFNHQLDGLAQGGRNDGWGIHSELLTAPFQNPNSPIGIQLGAKMDISFTGGELTGTSYLDEDGYWYDLRVSNANVGGYGFIRLSTQPTSRIRVYLDGQLGARWFYATEGLGDYDDDRCPKYDTQFLTSRLGLSWGGSAGLMIFMSETLGLDVKATLIQGNNASFVDLPSIQIVEANTYSYNVITARPRQFMIQAGLNFLLVDTCEEF